MIIMVNVAVYIRVSTDDQTEYSPDAQLKAIKAYAKNNNMFIDSDYIFKDEGISGRKAEKRPAFMKMIAIAKQKPKPFEVILVHKFDRFARNREDSIVYKTMLRKDCGIKVISITEHIEDDKFAIILESMLEAMAEYYSINLSDEVLKGMTEKARRGEYQANPPLGYKKQKGDKLITINKDEAEIIKFIFDNSINGMPTVAIAKKLNELGIKTRNRGKFTNRAVNYILRNPIYKGYTRWTPGKRKFYDFEYKNTIVIKGNFEPIISEEKFDLLQEKLSLIQKTTSPKSRPQAEYRHWLSGLIKCSACRSSLISGGSNGNFQCGNYLKGKCTVSHSIKKHIIEEIVINELKNQLKLDNFIDFEKKLICKSDNSIEIQNITKSINSYKQKLVRAKSAFLDGVDTLPEYKENKMKLEKEIKSLEIELKKLKEKKFNPDDLKMKISKTYEIICSNTNDIEKSTAIKSILDCIILYRPGNKITFRYWY